MHIELSQTGGVGNFPGLSKPVTLDVDQLEEVEQAELRLLVEAARFFDLPDSMGTPAPGAADYQYFILTIADGEHRRTVRALVPVENVPLRELIQSIRKHLKARGGTSKSENR